MCVSLTIAKVNRSPGGRAVTTPPRYSRASAPAAQSTISYW